MSYFYRSLTLFAFAACVLLPAVTVAGEKGEKGEKPFVKKGEVDKKPAVIDYEMKAGTVYVIDMENNKFPAVVAVKAPGKNILLDGQGGKDNAKLIFTAPTDGKYQLMVFPATPKASGKFTLTVRTRKAMFTAEDKLTAEDKKGKVQKGAHYKGHKVKLQAGKNYLIFLHSKTLDTYVALEDSDGKKVGENDDIRPPQPRSPIRNLNSRLAFRPRKTGTYNILASTYEPGKTGSYQIVVVEVSSKELKAVDPSAGLIGSTAPDLTATFSFNGKTKNLSSLKGKVVMVDFWAVWCGPCIATFPHLRDWAKEYKDDGLEIVGVTTYYKRLNFENGKLAQVQTPLTEKEENAMLQAFVKHHKLTHRIMAISQQEWQNATKAYGFSGIPTVAVIDRQGKVRLVLTGGGQDNARTLETTIKGLLKEK